MKTQWLNRFEVLIENVLLENKEIIILGDLLNLNINNVWSNFITSFGLSQLITERTYTGYKYGLQILQRSCIYK